MFIFYFADIRVEAVTPINPEKEVTTPNIRGILEKNFYKKI